MYLKLHIESEELKMWGTADDYLEKHPEVLKEIMSKFPPIPKRTDLSNWDKWIAINTKNEARRHPRPGQPDYNAPLEDWLKEKKTRDEWIIQSLKDEGLIS